MSDEFRVGDRIQGRLSGKKGTVTRVETGGDGRQRVWGKQDAAAYNWDDLPADRFILLERATPVFKAGDKARGKARSIYNAEPREITHYGTNWVIYDYEGDEHAISRRSFDECFEAVPDFFEAGRRYKYATATFDCVYLEENSDGRKAAIGRTEWRGDGPYWDIRTDFTNWKEL